MIFIWDISGRGTGQRACGGGGKHLSSGCAKLKKNIRRAARVGKGVASPVPRDDAHRVHAVREGEPDGVKNQTAGVVLVLTEGDKGAVKIHIVFGICGYEQGKVAGGGKLAVEQEFGVFVGSRRVCEPYR